MPGAALRRCIRPQTAVAVPATTAVLAPVPILDGQLELLVAATQRAMDDEHDVDMALRPDREGIGAAVGAEA